MASRAETVETRRVRWPSAVALVVIAATVSCVSNTGFRQQYLKTRNDLLQGNWSEAVEQYVAAKEIYAKRDRVMYWLNLGTLQHYAGQWAESQKNLIKAERAIQDLFTTSVSAEATKYTISETLAPYEGEDFEKILVYYFTAMNNVQQGKIRDALVEARRADEFLKKIQVRYANDDDMSTIYKEDAFMLWLVGLFYELEGSHNDAFLAYKRSYEVYQTDYRRLFRTRPPSYLAEDVVRAGLMAGLTEDADAFGREHEATGGTAALGRTKAELIVIHAGGEAPYKEQRFINAPLPGGYIARVALPQFKATKPQIAKSIVQVADKEERTDMAEPVSTIALRNFKHQLPGITARAVARAAVKYGATQGTKKLIQGGKKASDERKLAGALVGLFGNIAGAAAENADLRAWSLLPAYFRVARLWVPAGRHTVDVRFLDLRGNEVRAPEKITVDVTAGERKILNLRTVR